MKQKEVKKENIIENNDNAVKDILLKLKDIHTDCANDAQFSSDLFALGAHTKLTKTVEKLINSPLDSLYELTNEMDDKLKTVVDSIVKSYFTFKKDIIANVYKSSSEVNILHYSIVLKQDNIANRSTMFDFFDTYDNIALSNKYPVYFQFTPQELIEKIKIKEEVSFS